MFLSFAHAVKPKKLRSPATDQRFFPTRPSAAPEQDLPSPVHGCTYNGSADGGLVTSS